MTGWVSGLDALWSPAMALLLQVSLVLLAGLLLQQIAGRPAAARYAVLLWTLVAVGLCPVLAVAVQAAGVRPLVSFGNSIPFDLPLRSSGLTATLASGSPATVPNRSLLAAALLALWAAGALVGMARLSASWRTVRRLRCAAASLDGQRIARLVETIENRLGRRVPQILVSEQAWSPMALGCWRPVVLLPASLLDRLDDGQLSQVAMHECAHALRRDALVGLCQRVLSAVFWFHPLIHFANRLLDRVREEICDNYVLRVGNASAYSRTLLEVAQWLPPLPDERFAPALCHPACRLEYRVAGLLDPRRCLMTKLTAKKSAAIAIGFICGALAFSCLAGAAQDQTRPSNDFSHVVRSGKTYSQAGDRIMIDEVRGPSDKRTIGNTYEVRGTYKLASRDQAVLGAFVTTSTSQPEVPHEVSPEQTMKISKGEGRFTLRFHMWHDGDPHVSFYPAAGGESFGGVYF